jgi:hypothetical protein
MIALRQGGQGWMTIDEAVFYNFLAVSSLCLTARDTLITTPSLEATYLHTRAISSINARLADRQLCQSDGVIACIVNFASQGISRSVGGTWCWEAHFRLLRSSAEVDEWKLNMDGLRLVLEMRGGADSITANPGLRINIFT